MEYEREEEEGWNEQGGECSRKIKGGDEVSVSKGEGVEARESEAGRRSMWRRSIQAEELRRIRMVTTRMVYGS